MAFEVRPTWDDVYMQVADIVASRATCVRRKVGAVLVKENHMVGSGYNGAVVGAAHCDSAGCTREQNNIPSGERYEECSSVHGEANAIIQAAIHRTGIKGATLYINYPPCFMCARMIVNAGIVKVVYRPAKEGDFSKSIHILKEGGVQVETYLAGTDGGR
jgi:dCMP deaminase